MKMYIYFDRNGTIQEVINDESIRKGSNDYNKIYCYLEGNPDIDDIWYLQKNPDGTLTNEVSFVDNVVTKAIPYDAKRDMKYFQDFEEYQFYVFTLLSSYLSQNGLVVATIRVAENNTLWALGELTFNVQANVINSDNDITQSQYDYLLLTISSYYSKTEIDNKLSLKADKSNTYTKTEVDGKLDLKADKSDTYTKTEVDTMDLNLAGQMASNKVELQNEINSTNNNVITTIARVTVLENDVDSLKSVQNVVEVVATYSALQSYDTSKLDVNDKVQVIADETHDGASTIYNWNGSAWVYVGAFGGNSYTKAETYNKTQIDSALSDKADKSNTYTRAVIDSMILTLSTDKADKSDVYTKTEEDAKFEEVGTNFGILEKEVEKKADKTDTYTKQEVNDKLDGYIKDNDTTYSATVRGKEVIVSTGAGYGSTTYGHGSIHIGNPRKPTCDYYFPEEKSGTLALTSDIPTVNNPTITFTQGGTTKGSISLNQASDQTIDLDAGGSGGSGTTVIANPTLVGTEADLTGLEVDGTKYKVSSGGGGSEVHLYGHFISAKPNSNSIVNFVIYSNDNISFTSGTLKQWLKNNGFSVTSNNSYVATGYYTTGEVIIGVGVTGSNIEISTEYINDSNALAHDIKNPISFSSLTDTIIQIF